MRRETYELIQGEVFSFESQVSQYPALGEPGIGYFAGDVGDDWPPIDCLLWRDEQGRVRGILNHYAADYPMEKRGNINIFVDPQWHRRGIATALLKQAEQLYGPTNWKQQRYSREGLAMMLHYRQS